jgi:hypothetical protein
MPPPKDPETAPPQPRAGARSVDDPGDPGSPLERIGELGPPPRPNGLGKGEIDGEFGVRAVGGERATGLAGGGGRAPGGRKTGVPRGFDGVVGAGLPPGGLPPPGGPPPGGVPAPPPLAPWAIPAVLTMSKPARSRMHMVLRSAAIMTSASRSIKPNLIC